MANSNLAVDKGIDRFDSWVKDHLVYLVAFFLPVISMIIVYALKDIHPFGDNMYLRSDNYHQYTPYLQILQDKLSNGGSLFYSWEIGTGMNFLAVAAYYLASPFNLLLLFFKGKVVDLVAFFIISKMGLASLTTTYYLVKKHEKKTIVAALFGMAYGLSAYFAAFSWNIMWLDCMFLLPLIVLGLDKLVKEGKYLTYTIALAVAIFSNYYIGIMLCIFSVIYFIYLMFTVDVNDDIKPFQYYLVTTVKYGISSLISGGLAALVIIPEYCNLLTTRSADSEFPEKMERYFSVLFMFFRSLLFVPVADLKYPHNPNIYCSVAVFILIPLYFLCSKISVKERVGKFVLVVIMLLSFNLNIPNYIWHGLHFPNSLPCRESFIYIFLLLTMGYEAALHIKDFTDKQLVGVFAGAVGLILILEDTMRYVFTDGSSTDYFTEITAGVETDMFKIIYYSLAAVAIYTILIFIYRKRPDIRGFVVYLLLLTSFAELTYNMNVTSIPSCSNRTAYYESTPAFKKLNEIAKKDAEKEDVLFFRSEEAVNRTRNDGGLFGYNSISTFSSVSSANIQYYYDAIGLQTSFNAYSYYGHTPLTSALFALKYEYSTGAPSIPNMFDFVDSSKYVDSVNNTLTLNLYKNKTALPLGFMIDANTNKNWYTESGNPFDVQNNFVKSAIPNFNKSIFHKLSTDGSGSIQTMYSLDPDDGYVSNGAEQTYDVYFFVSTSAENLTATISGPDGTSSSKSFNSTHQNYICYVGEVAAESTINVTANDGSSVAGLFAYAFDKNAFNEAYNILNSQGLKITSMKDTKINGTVNATTDGLMYTSIPYDKGWSVYVDGKKVKTLSICKDALLGFNVSAGEHKIELKYTPDGLIKGLILSFISLIILIVLIVKRDLITKISDSFINKRVLVQPQTKKTK